MAKTLVFTDTERLLSGWHDDGALRLWGFDSGRLVPVAEIPAHDGPIVALALSGSGVLASSSGGETLRLWKTGDSGLEELQILLSGDGDSVTAMAFSLDGSLLALGTESGRLQLWRQGGLGFELTASVEAHREGISSLAFHPDGIRLFSGGRDWMIRVWAISAESGWNELGQMKGHSASVSGLSFNPRNWTLASSGEESSVRIWTGEGDVPVELTTLRGYAEAVTDVAYDRTGTILASSSRDRWVKVWQQIGEIFGLCGSLGTHEAPVISVCFSPDSEYLVSQSEDGRLKCWRVGGI